MILHVIYYFILKDCSSIASLFRESEWWFDSTDLTISMLQIFFGLFMLCLSWFITEPNILEKIGREDFWHIHDLVELFVWNRSSRWNPTWIFWKPHQLQQINHRSSCKCNKEKLGMRNPHEQWKNPRCLDEIILPSCTRITINHYNDNY